MLHLFVQILTIPKNLDLDNPEIRILRTYRPIGIDDLVENRLLAMAQNDSIFNAKVLHVNKNKLNQWTLSLIYEKYGLDGITMLSKILGYKVKVEQYVHCFFVYVAN